MLTLNEVLENLQQLFAVQEYTAAAQIIETAREIPELYNDTVAIYDANLCLMNNNYPQMWEAIHRGLSCNCKNPELYVLLGEYYLPTNPNQAYLCFENALFYCEDENDRATIQEYMDNLKRDCDITVRKTSFIILSYNLLDYTRGCIESIRKNSPESAREIVIVDNASKDGSVEWLKQQKDIILRVNAENSGFPKGCNEGVEVASKENDIFLFNNDTYLPPNALFWLRMGLYEDESHGAVGSVSNYVSNLQQLPFANPTTESLIEFAKSNNVPMAHPYETKTYLVGFALLIRRDVYNLVGDLDERFSPGNYEDTDYGLRVMQAGYKNVLCKNSFIIHYGSKSFGKQADTYANIMHANAQKFVSKWNINIIDDLYPRQDLASLIKENKAAAFCVLDIGCRLGSTAAYLKGKYPNAYVCGIETRSDMAHMAQQNTDVLCLDLEKTPLPFDSESFDYIIINDVLECMQNPAEVLKNLRYFLKKGGKLLVSAYNLKHYSVILPLLMQDRFSYGENGTLCTTHQKLFTGTEMQNILVQAGFHVDAIHSVMAGEPDASTNNLINLLAQISENKNRGQYLVYKYLFVAK